MDVVGRICHRSNVNHRIRCRISNTYRYMAVFIGRKKMEIVCKKIELRFCSCDCVCAVLVYGCI